MGKLSTEAVVGQETGSSGPFSTNTAAPKPCLDSSLIINLSPVPDTDSKEGYLPDPASENFSTAPLYLIHRTRLCAGTMTCLHCIGKELQHAGMTASWLPVGMLRFEP